MEYIEQCKNIDKVKNEQPLYYSTLYEHIKEQCILIRSIYTSYSNSKSAIDKELQFCEEISESMDECDFTVYIKEKKKIMEELKEPISEDEVKKIMQLNGDLKNKKDEYMRQSKLFKEKEFEKIIEDIEKDIKNYPHYIYAPSIKAYLKSHKGHKSISLPQLLKFKRDYNNYIESYKNSVDEILTYLTQLLYFILYYREKYDNLQKITNFKDNDSIKTVRKLVNTKSTEYSLEEYKYYFEELNDVINYLDNIINTFNNTKEEVQKEMYYFKFIIVYH